MRAAWPGAEDLERRGGSGASEAPPDPGLEQLRDLGAPASRAGLLSCVPTCRSVPACFASGVPAPPGPRDSELSPDVTLRFLPPRAFFFFFFLPCSNVLSRGANPRGFAKVRRGAPVAGAGDRVIQVACGTQGREAGQGQGLGGLLRLPFAVSAQVDF